MIITKWIIQITYLVPMYLFMYKCIQINILISYLDKQISLYFNK